MCFRSNDFVEGFPVLLDKDLALLHALAKSHRLGSFVYEHATADHHAQFVYGLWNEHPRRLRHDAEDRGHGHFDENPDRGRGQKQVNERDGL